MATNKSLQSVILRDENGNPVGITLDGSVYRLEQLAKVLNAAGSQINPATQETLASIDGKDFATETKLETVRALLQTIDADTGSIDSKVATDVVLQTVRDRIGEISATPTVNTLQDRLRDVQSLLSSIDTKDFATQTTLSSILTKLTEIDTALDAINLTTGIKQIVDPLPAGTNNIGDVDVVSSALPTGAATEATLSTRATAAAQTDGSQRSQVRSGAKGTSVAANLTSTPVDANTEALHTDTRAWLGSTAPTVGQKTMAASLPLAIASDQTEFPISQGTKGTGSNAWPSVLYDAAGNAVAITLESSVYRLEALSKLRNAAGTIINPATSDIQTDGTQRAKITDGTNNASLIQDGASYRLQVEATLGAPSPTSQISTTLQNAGSSNLLVDGSGTPVDFTFSAHATRTYVLQRVQFIMSADSVNHNGTSFGKGSSLTNGVLLDGTVNNGVSISIGTFKINEEFGVFDYNIFQNGLKDFMTATYEFGGRTVLEPGSGDQLRVRVQDNLTSAALGLAYFVSTILVIDEG